MSDIVRDTSPASLARANEANMAEGMAACVRAFGGVVMEEPDLLWSALPLQMSGWNRVTRANLAPGTEDERIETFIAQARALDVPFLWYIGPSMRPTNLSDYLLRHGFTEAGDDPAMGMALADLPEKAPTLPGVTIELVTDIPTLRLWNDVLDMGFEMGELSEPFMELMMRDTIGEGAAATYYLARLDGEPVAAAALSLGGGVAGIFSVATIPAARRRGLGAAVTLAPLLDARARGYAVGVLQASEMGYPVYERLGFTEQFRYHVYRWRP